CRWRCGGGLPPEFACSWDFTIRPGVSMRFWHPRRTDDRAEPRATAPAAGISSFITQPPTLSKSSVLRQPTPFPARQQNAPRKRHVVLKRPADVERMRAAGAIVARVIEALRKQCIPGVTTAELDDLAARLIHDAG